MNRRKSKFVWLGLGIYLIVPFFAGVFSIGNKLGPRLYPESLHVVVYSIGYRAAYDTKPRVAAAERRA